MKLKIVKCMFHQMIYVTSCGGWQKYSNMRGVCYVLTTTYAKGRTVHRFSRQVSNLFSSDCFLQFKATKSQMERTARILTRKKDAIQHKMVMFAVCLVAKD